MGEPVISVAPEQLRRHIGYAIQSVGLFPHMTVARNIATVPRLLRWDRRRIETRVTELLALVGLDPVAYARQAARASCRAARRSASAWPGRWRPTRRSCSWTSPSARSTPSAANGSSASSRTSTRRLGKTVVFVTHDIEEAVLLGDRIVLMRDGRIVQVGAPEELWRSPGHQFVRDFFGDEFGLRILSRHRVLGSQRSAPPPRAKRPASPRRPTCATSLAIMVTESVDQVAVVVDGQVVGGLTFCEVVTQVRQAHMTHVHARESGATGASVSVLVRHAPGLDVLHTGGGEACLGCSFRTNVAARLRPLAPVELPAGAPRAGGRRGAHRGRHRRGGGTTGDEPARAGRSATWCCAWPTSGSRYRRWPSWPSPSRPWATAPSRCSWLWSSTASCR